jgi:hypothetical protein
MQIFASAEAYDPGCSSQNITHILISCSPWQFTANNIFFTSAKKVYSFDGENIYSCSIVKFSVYYKEMIGYEMPNILPVLANNLKKQLKI